MRSVLLPSIVLTAAVLLVACGGGDNGQPVTPTPSPEAPSPTPPAVVCDSNLVQDLAVGQPDTVIYGADAGDFLADRFSLVSGDFNGDGFDDLLIGAPLADGPNNERESAGEAYVVFGSSSPPATIDLARGDADLILFGEESQNNFGFTVASGDVNGDGIDDVLVGGRFASLGVRAGAGKTYVVFGEAGLGGEIDALEGEQDVVVVGRDPGDLSSIALASGDVNGDGMDDLIIGASAADGPTNDRRDAGEVDVVLGSNDLAGLIDLNQEAGHFTVYGAKVEDALANNVTSGDVDNDGKDELILGAHFAERGEAEPEDAGEAYVVDVPDGGGSLDLASDEGLTRISGAGVRDAVGFYVAAGDLNGDGFDDIIVGARNADGVDDKRNNSGEVHILLGSEQLPASRDLAQESLDITIYGAGVGDSLGFSLATGDLNDDGLADILIGSPVGAGCKNTRASGGKAYAILGNQTLQPSIDVADETFDLSILGAEAGDELGFSVTMGDINGDGKDDVIAGALLADGPDNTREDAGEAYIILRR